MEVPIRSKNRKDYILPDSDSRYLTDSDVRGLSANELMLARNEIYARHGRKFKDSELQNYFTASPGIEEPWIRMIFQQMYSTI